MRQEINLLPDGLSTKSLNFSFNHLLIALMVLSIVYLMYIYSQYSALNTIKEKIAKIEQEIVGVDSSIGGSKPLVNYKNKISSLEARLEKKKNLMKSYTEIPDSERIGFSNYFVEMAKLSSRNMSIDSIKVLNGGRHLLFSGYSNHPESVPDYINELKQKSLFDDVVLGDLSMERVKGSGLMKFFLEDNFLSKENLLDRRLIGGS